VKILSLRPKAEDKAAPKVGPAHAAYLANRAEEARLQSEIDRVVAIDTDVLGARANAQARVDAPITYRTQLARAEVASMAQAELGGTAVNGTLVEDLRIQLEEAERLAGPAATRGAVETAKHETLLAQIDALRTQQRQVHNARAALGAAALRERLNDEIAPLTAARATYMQAFNRAYAVACAVDRLARDTGSGEFVGSSGAADLCLPTPTGMAPLPYTLEEHWTSLEKSATEILQEMGLAAH
jgi:hypothetical protein